MSQPIQHPMADVVVLGLGAMGGVIAVETAKAGYKTVGLERGPYWDFTSDFTATKYDEWGIGFMRKFDHKAAVSAPTLRNDRSQFALPVRRNTAGGSGQYITEGFGVGGMTQHYGGLMGRFPPWVYQMYSETVQKYGLDFLNATVPHQDITDWPMTYDEHVPYYNRWEKMWGVTGTNEGPLVPGLTNYPLPPAPTTPLGTMYRDAAEALGYNAYPTPTSLATQAFTNEYGVQCNECVYDGWCGAACNYVCETGAKANPANRTIPAALQTGNFDMRTGSWIFRLDTDASGKVTAARYLDLDGNVHVQPGKVFFNGLWGYNLIRMMLISGIGTPYDPVNITGTLGRGAANGVPAATVRSISGDVNVGGNAYCAGNALAGGFTFMEFADDFVDHTGLDFIGGAYPFGVGGYLGGGPGNFNLYANGPDPSMMGSSFKGKIKDIFLPAKLTVNIAPYGMWPPTTDWFIDIDPHYTDAYGDPVARMTLDYGQNTFKTANYFAPLYRPLLERMGATNIRLDDPVSGTDQHMFTFPAHIRGGARIGTDQASSVFNKWHQCWTSENLFAAGEVTDPVGDNTTVGGTHPAGAASYVAAEGIIKYLQSPGMLT